VIALCGRAIPTTLQLRREQPVQPVLTALHDSHNADLAPHTKMLGYRWLREPHPRNDVIDRPLLAIVKEADNLSTPRFRHCVEVVGSGRRSSPCRFYIPLSEYLPRVFFSPSESSQSMPSEAETHSEF